MPATHQSSTASRGQSDKAEDDQDSAEEDQPRVGPEELSCPKGSVPLHRLCNRCQRMFGALTEVYAWLDKALSLQARAYKPTGRELEPCTLADLAEYRKSCHFCEIVCSGIKDFDNTVPQDPITFQFRESNSLQALLYMDVSLEGNPRSMQIICIKSFIWFPNNVFGVPFIAQHVPRQPKDNLNQIRIWLDACRSKHDRCSNWCSKLGMKGRRPTRVLELSDNAVRLRCDLHAIDGLEYLALSHMWGTDPSQQLRLTASTLQEFQNVIPLEMLPGIFTEAIRITRYLGFRYLWIDSLCIIQDSKSDWIAEANMMSAVYNNAVCTIAVLFPPQIAFGPTQWRDDPRALTPCIVRKPILEETGICVFPSEFLKRSALAQKDWPLSSRAWTLQEHILSPRTIFYGHRTLKWECVNIFCDELAGTIGNGTELNTTSRTQKERLSVRPTRGPKETSGIKEQFIIPFDTFWNWVELVKEYRRRDLTQASDRTMALSGIAQAFQAEHGLSYLAGIWKEHLPRSLLWRIIHSADRPEPFSLIPLEPTLKSAPTWSLFAGPIYSNRDNELYYDWFRHVDHILSSAKLVRFRWLKAPVDHIPPTAFHDFEGLQITFELMTIDVSFSLRDPIPEYNSHKVRCKSTEARLASLLKVGKEHVVISFHFDNLRHFKQPPTGARIAVIEEEHLDYFGEYKFKGLVIEPGAERETWKRVGYCEGKARPDSPRPGEFSLESPAEETIPGTSPSELGEESIFLRLEGAKIETLTLV